MIEDNYWTTGSDVELENFSASQSMLTQEEVDALLGGPEWVEKRKVDYLELAIEHVANSRRCKDASFSNNDLACAIQLLVHMLERRGK